MLQLETIENSYSFHSYDKQSASLIKPDHSIHSNQSIEDTLVQISSTTIIYKDKLDNTNLPAQFMDFDQNSITRLLEHNADIYLIGTGSIPCFPEKELFKYITKNKLPIDFMDTGAACRTFNILTGEYRNVAALIFFQ
ncbi:MAG: Mth938-like domain-containing protein [gamma proteobacterium symbiont of Taylorina sp.]|nr:Mth938-like domain-containing protein [gamma proteobacterium symbiont of Taylorina sp.]